MKIGDITKENDESWLKITDLENMFRVVTDRRGNYAYNLNETMYFDVSDDDLVDYDVTKDMHWPLISYKIYSTTRLAWLLMKLNRVKTEDSFEIIPAGSTIKCLDRDSVQSVILSINDYGEG